MQRHLTELLRVPRKPRENAEPSDKFSQIVAKVNEIIHLNMACKNNGGDEPTLVKRLDDLLGFMLAQFAEPSHEISKPKFDNLEVSKVSLNEIPEHVVPLVVIRHLLFNHRIIVDPRNLKHWSRFSSRYQRFVLS